MSYVPGYTKRIKFTTDPAKVDSDLAYFPVTTFFTATQAEEVFAELDADEDFDRGQFALADGTLLKAEKELFDHSEFKGIYHVKIPSVSSSVGTIYYFYYNNNADHNTSYIGIIGSAVAAEVWDDGGNNYFKAVYHMVDGASTSAMYDSTSNNYDCVKKAANEPIEESGEQQHFDGADDYISQATLLDTVPANGTWSAYFAPDDASETTDKRILYKRNSANDRLDMFWDADASAGSRFVKVTKKKTTYTNLTGTTSLAASTYYLATCSWGPQGLILYINGVSEDSDADTTTWVNGTVNDFSIGVLGENNTQHWDGIYKEVRVSNTERNAAWNKATYNSLRDSLLTYHPEETRGNAIMFGMNF